MTHSELTETYRQTLIAQRAALLAKIAQHRGGMRSRAEVAEEHFAHSEDSPAQVATERDLEFALNERETGELGQIAQAFTRLDQGTYGYCADCGAPIAEERLRITPHACRCIACQEKAEQRPHSLHS